MRGTKGLKIAVFDTETDPFLRDRLPKPFACGFYDGSTYIEEWGAACVNKCMRRVCEYGRETGQKFLIYVHNGGKFDFWFMWNEMDPTAQMTIINGRLVEWAMEEDGHVFRDSLAIIPVALADYQKEKIDYGIFECRKREHPANKMAIRAYLKSDCVNLFSLVLRFSDRFRDDRGNIPISIGQASVRELQKLHPFEILTEAADAEARQFYMGGRVQCFQAGILKGPWKVYDMNSAYWEAMRNYDHPVTSLSESLEHPPKAKRGVWFARFRGSNRQALPLDTDDGITFTVQHGEFFACSHELVPALRAGLVRVDDWLEILAPSKYGRFEKFIDAWTEEKIAAELQGDKAGRLFAKSIGNSAYGKTGQNPADFKDYKILHNIMGDKKLRQNGFEPDVRVSEDPFIEVWSRKAPFHNHGFFNVGIAASVTSATRALLLAGLQLAQDPIYCDTDSIICRAFQGETHPTRLGAWKQEAEAEYCAIGGKKMYCLYNKDGRRVVPIKWASKGGDLRPEDIIEIAKGGEVDFTSEVPTYSLTRGVTFISRKFRKTVEKPQKWE